VSTFARPDLLDDDAWDDLDEGLHCDVCGAPVEFGERNPCDDCTGLRGCPDDMCHGLGYCMHKPDAWIP
jgi:hypothetical protein